MRELKFRVWDKSWKRFIKGDLFFEQEEQGTFEPDCYHDEEGEIHSLKYLQRKLDRYHGYDIQQYTGLKDKDNKEIYEGDIVRFSEPTKLAEDCYMSTLYVFDFYNGSFLRPYIYNSINGGKFSKVGETKLNPVGRAKMEDNAHFDLTKAEVVGNIFETPFEIDL
jgi:uncharacterized phage protein (TIGR01671 family)